MESLLMPTGCSGLGCISHPALLVGSNPDTLKHSEFCLPARTFSNIDFFFKDQCLHPCSTFSYSQRSYTWFQKNSFLFTSAHSIAHAAFRLAAGHAFLLFTSWPSCKIQAKVLGSSWVLVCDLILTSPSTETHLQNRTVTLLSSPKAKPFPFPSLLTGK